MTSADWVPRDRDRSWRTTGPSSEVMEFHRGLDGYEPTPLVDLPAVAAELGVGRALAKDESRRLDLPAFKALGASWAVHRSLQERGWDGEATLVTATDGNHGRAVARFARMLGHRASIVVPRGVSEQAIAAIVGEGAAVTRVDGSYDDAVAEAERLGSVAGALLVQDTAWPGYETVPGWIVDGYSTLFAELDAQLGGAPDLVIVPAGVGSLLQAALAHYRRAGSDAGTAVVSVEPVTAACVMASCAAGEPVQVETGETVLAGLNCGTVSSLAWPLIEGGLDGAVAVTDDAALAAARDLGALGVDAGPCGGAGLAGLRSLLGVESAREHLRVGASSAVAFVVTEGSEANPLG